MVLTTKQVEQYKSGTLTKSNFAKLIDTIDFEEYLYRYCKIVNDSKHEYLNNFYRYTNFSVFNYHIIVSMVNGECTKIDYTILNNK